MPSARRGRPESRELRSAHSGQAKPASVNRTKRKTARTRSTGTPSYISPATSSGENPSRGVLKHRFYGYTGSLSHPLARHLAGFPLGIRAFRPIHLIYPHSPSLHALRLSFS
jgi:hypothetical protein